VRAAASLRRRQRRRQAHAPAARAHPDCHPPPTPPCPRRQRFIDQELNKRLGRPAADPLDALSEGERVRLAQEQELFAVPEELKVGAATGV
jgi:hypothetical protein